MKIANIRSLNVIPRETSDCIAKRVLCMILRSLIKYFFIFHLLNSDHKIELFIKTNIRKNCLMYLFVTMRKAQ